MYSWIVFTRSLFVVLLPSCNTPSWIDVVPKEGVCSNSVMRLHSITDHHMIWQKLVLQMCLLRPSAAGTHFGPNNHLPSGIKVRRGSRQRYGMAGFTRESLWLLKQGQIEPLICHCCWVTVTGSTSGRSFETPYARIVCLHHRGDLARHHIQLIVTILSK